MWFGGRVSARGSGIQKYTYIEITSGNKSANGSTEPVDEIKVCDCECKAEINMLRDRCDKHHQAFCQLKEYVLNIERVLGDEIKYTAM